MRGARAALAGALVLSAACASHVPGRDSAGQPPLQYAGPAGWEVRILHQPPPYGLAQFVEPRTEGVPDASRGFLLVGKSRVEPGYDPLRSACRDQRTIEAASAIPPVDWRPLQVVRSGMTCVGWQARRVLPDGTPMRLRALCGARRTQSVYLYLSAPDRSQLYEPTWENLLRLNVDQE